MKTFNLKALKGYSCNHFKRSENIVEDVKAALYLDGYHSISLFSTKEIAQMLMSHLENSDINYKLREFVADISVDDCWKVGYRVEKENYCYYTAIIYKVLSLISMSGLSDLNWQEWPNYKASYDNFNKIVKHKSSFTELGNITL